MARNILIKNGIIVTLGDDPRKYRVTALGDPETLIGTTFRPGAR